MIIEINKDIEKYQESVAMGLSAKQLVYSILALGSGCIIVFLLYEKIGLTFSCYVAVPIVAPVALCGFYSYNGMGFREVFTRYMRSIFRNKALVFQSSDYREMVSEIKTKEEAEKRAAVRKAKEECRCIWKEKMKSRIKGIIRKSMRKTGKKGRGKNGFVEKILRPSEGIPINICVLISDKAVIYGFENADASCPCSLCR